MGNHSGDLPDSVQYRPVLEPEAAAAVLRAVYAVALACSLGITIMAALQGEGRIATLGGSSSATFAFLLLLSRPAQVAIAGARGKGNRTGKNGVWRTWNPGPGAPLEMSCRELRAPACPIAPRRTLRGSTSTQEDAPVHPLEHLEGLVSLSQSTVQLSSRSEQGPRSGAFHGGPRSASPCEPRRRRRPVNCRLS